MKPCNIISTILLATAVGCGSSDVGQETSLVRDRFRAPTYHGDLSFEEGQSSEFTADERFHAWTFELTDEASVRLTTGELGRNIDTVMYLYRAEEDGQEVVCSGGDHCYVARNNDFVPEDGDGPVLASQISETLPRGRYLVQVQAHKTQIRGSFSLFAACRGTGCPVEDAPSSLEAVCAELDAGVSACQGEDGRSCSPLADPTAIQCCRALDFAWCADVCVGGPARMEADLGFLGRSTVDTPSAQFEVWGTAAQVEGCDVSFAEAVDAALRSFLSPEFEEAVFDNLEQDPARADGDTVDPDELPFAETARRELDRLARARTPEVFRFERAIAGPGFEQALAKYVVFYSQTGTTFVVEGVFRND
ncbi:MAG: hypothetical protein AAGA56_00605 [Myxococcota bacterium]